MDNIQATLQSILNKVVDGKKVFGTSFAIKKDNHIWQAAAGDLALNQKYYIASVTKLFTTAIVLQLRSKALLKLEDAISLYLDNAQLNQLHIYKGNDYSRTITIKHLLSHTSGLPDYFQDKSANGSSLENEIKNGVDQSWTFEQAIEKSKKIKPLFVPGAKSKAHYSDTNFQLLGKIIENITHKSFADNCNKLIIEEMNLTNTYLYQEVEDNTVHALYFKSKALHIPKAMSSFGADGSMVSTSADMLTFIEAFFTGQLFPKEYIPEMQQWNRIFFPMKAGLGIHLFKLPWLLNPRSKVPSFIGHSGALAFYSPKQNLFIAGTVNQIAHPDISFKTMVKLSQLITQ